MVDVVVLLRVVGRSVVVVNIVLAVVMFVLTVLVRASMKVESFGMVVVVLVVVGIE